MSADTARPARNAPGPAGAEAVRHDPITAATLIGAAALLVFTAWRFVRHLETPVAGGHQWILVALALNVALLVVGWRRYRDVRHAVTQHGEAEARARLRVRVDELTGLLTRRGLAEDGLAIAGPGFRRHRAAALIRVDIDNFKFVNERQGHLAGDAVLRAVAATVRDALPADAIAARLDGDSFAVLLPHDGRHPGTISSLADYLLGALAQPIETRGATTHIGVSVGIASAPSDEVTVEMLVRRASIAVQASKAAGRGRRTWFDTGMERALAHRSAIEAGLREGIPAGQFIPFYEPQVELHTGQLLGFEVLARWQHPEHGLIPPDEFIPVAEECGLIAELSAAIMRRAFVEARDWDPTLGISVNISPAQLKDPWLAQKIVKLLVETGFPPNRLEIEITESSLFQNLPLAQSIVSSLKNQGIRLALDDFGTGYSSLAHLRALPFDRIKIDKSFVIAMATDPEAAAIVDAISRLGESLNLTITAEGVEDEAIADRLRRLGCAKGQGWHYGRPSGIAAVRRMLAERGLLPVGRAHDAGAMRKAG